jgi:hypothetical protein
MAALGWARSTEKASDRLRRGAWYPIVERSGDGHVTVQVEQENIRFPVASLLIRTEAPDRWSIVVRSGVMRPTWSGQKVTNAYAVCPWCRARQEFKDQPEQLECDRCQHTSPVDWAEKC